MYSTGMDSSVVESRPNFYLCACCVLFLVASVCESVCLFAENLENYWSEINASL